MTGREREADSLVVDLVLGAVAGSAVAGLVLALTHPHHLAWIAVVAAPFLVILAGSVFLPATSGTPSRHHAARSPSGVPPAPALQPEQVRLWSEPVAPPSAPPSRVGAAATAVRTNPAAPSHPRQLAGEPASVSIAVPGGRWWDAPAAPQVRPVHTGEGSGGRPAPPLTAYGSSELLAQCPSCGDLRIAVRTHDPERCVDMDFACFACGHRWTWRRGEDWPPTTVRPHRPTRS